jgi:hypothetical protein
VIVSIMQPYFLPYVGYFQLIAASDLFVLYDEAQYMKGGWINRNRILLQGQPHWLTVPIAHDSVTAPINARRYRLDAQERRRLNAVLHAAYARAPQAEAALPLLAEALACPDDNVARFNAHALKRLCDALDIRTPMVRASELDRDRALRGQEAVIDMASRLGARTYLNPPGGVDLYAPEAFAARGIDLAFLSPRPPAYPQFGGEPAPNLSIADVLMFCEGPRLAEQLAAYDIVSPAEAKARRRA